MTQDVPGNLKVKGFYYEMTEEITRYTLGGYHPAIIGDILGESSRRQYRLMHKLGWGFYSTGWLAQTIDEAGTFVAVKIMAADTDSNAISQGIEMLQKAAEAQPDDQSDSHVLKLLDHFKMHGPNGTHTVIVTEVVVSILSLLSKQSPVWRKAAAYGVAQAMAHLHTNQIVHRDWHPRNVGVAMPQLGCQHPRSVMLELDSHKLTVVLPHAISEQTASLPAYLLSPCNIAAYYQMIAGPYLPQTKVLDFNSDVEKSWAEHWKVLRKGCENDEDTDALVRLLKAVLVPNPAERPISTRIVNDPWFQSVSTR